MSVNQWQQQQVLANVSSLPPGLQLLFSHLFWVVVLPSFEEASWRLPSYSSLPSLLSVLAAFLLLVSWASNSSRKPAANVRSYNTTTTTPPIRPILFVVDLRLANSGVVMFNNTQIDLRWVKALLWRRFSLSLSFMLLDEWFFSCRCCSCQCLAWLVVVLL